MKINSITHENIKPYGWIIDSGFIKDDGRGDKFGVLLKERSGGWRVGCLILRKKAIERLESHPDSLESFEPLSGESFIALAPKHNPDKFKIFLLDRPIILKKGIWHDVAALSRRCEIKIFENIDVVVKYHKLKEKR